MHVYKYYYHSQKSRLFNYKIKWVVASVTKDVLISKLIYVCVCYMYSKTKLKQTRKCQQHTKLYVSLSYPTVRSVRNRNKLVLCHTIHYDTDDMIIYTSALKMSWPTRIVWTRLHLRIVEQFPILWINTNRNHMLKVK